MLDICSGPRLWSTVSSPNFDVFVVSQRFFVDICDLPGTPDTIWPLMTNLPLMYHQQPLIFFTALCHTAQLAWETMTLYSNYSGIKQNLTYNEMQNGNRYAYLKSPTGYNYNPFDKGSFSANLRDFLHPPVDYRTLFFVSREALL